MTTDITTAARTRAIGHEPDRSVLVPLDGSSFASDALPVASVLAQRLGVPLDAVTVARRGAKVDVHESLARLQANDAELRVLAGDDAADVILRHTDDLGPCVICMSTHGHGRLAGSVLGSVARDLLRHADRPIVAIGPNARPRRDDPTPPTPFSVPRLVACVDGSEASEAIVPTAAAWAATLGMALTLLIVAEPAPDRSVPPAASAIRTGHLDAHDASSYVAGLAARWSGQVPGVTGEVVLDPIGPAAGVQAHLRDRPAGLLAVGTHARRGLRRLWSGDTAASIIHASPVPVLVVPVAVGHEVAAPTTPTPEEP